MPLAEQEKKFDAYNLCNAFETYIRQHRNSPDVNDRWLVNYLAEAHAFAKIVRNNNIPDELKKRVAEFRCAEIEAEKRRKQLEIDTLDGEMRRLKVRAAA